MQVNRKKNHLILIGFILDLAKYGNDMSFHMKIFHIATAETQRTKTTVNENSYFIGHSYLGSHFTN